MSAETSHLLNQAAVGLGVITMLWAVIVAGVEKKKLPLQQSGWSQSFVQATARYLTKKQKIAFFASMGCSIFLAGVAAIFRS